MKASTAVAIANLQGEMLIRTCVPTNKEHSVENVVEQVSSLIDDVIGRAHISPDGILGIGVSIGGVVDNTQGIIVFSPNFHWENVAFAERLEKPISLRTVIDNSTRLMALGERQRPMGIFFVRH